MKQWVLTVAAVLALAGGAAAQGQMLASPAGTAATQVGPKYSKWIEVTYSRPILRGRADIFGSGPTYGKGLLAGAPIWRAGAQTQTHIARSSSVTCRAKNRPHPRHHLGRPPAARSGPCR